MSLFLVFQESAALQTSLLKRNRRMKQRDCHLMQLYGAGAEAREVFLSWVSKVGATIEAPVGCGEGVSPSPPGEGFGEGHRTTGNTLTKL